MEEFIEEDMVRYPPGTVVKPEACDLAKLKKDYGGSLPDIKGRKCRYPPPTDEAAWRKLYAAALTYKNKERYCRVHNLKAPQEPCKSKYEYLLYHGKPEKKQDRSQRNKDRKINGLKKGDKLVVHHMNPNNLQTKDTVKLTHCQHQRMHGKVCKKEKKSSVSPKPVAKAKAKTKRTITIK